MAEPYRQRRRTRRGRSLPAHPQKLTYTVNYVDRYGAPINVTYGRRSRASMKHIDPDAMKEEWYTNMRSRFLEILGVTGDAQGAYFEVLGYFEWNRDHVLQVKKALHKAHFRAEESYNGTRLAAMVNGVLEALTVIKAEHPEIKPRLTEQMWQSLQDVGETTPPDATSGGIDTELLEPVP